MTHAQLLEAGRSFVKQRFPLGAHSSLRSSSDVKAAYQHAIDQLLPIWDLKESISFILGVQIGILEVLENK